MNRILTILDCLCLYFWKICRAALRAFWALLLVVARLVAGCWHILGKIPFVQFLWRPVDRFLAAIKTFFSSRPFMAMAGLVRRIVTAVDERLEESKPGRRFFLVLSIILVSFWLYPPSHWGPWYLYQKGIASHYGTGFYFRRTANGDWFLPFFHTAASKTLPLGITAKVVNPSNGKTVYVLVNDRGPYVKGRILDLSTAAARKIGLYEPGTGLVEIYTHKHYSARDENSKK